MTFSFSYGQNPQLKKVIKITKTFDYTYTLNGKLYSSRKGNVKQDTLITEYNQDGTLTKPFKGYYDTLGTFHLDSLILISNERDLKHEREFLSNSTYIDIYTHLFNDSTIQTHLFKNDTIKINQSYFKNGKLIKFQYKEFRPGYRKFNQVIIYDVNTKNREIGTIITTYSRDGIPDSTRFDNNKRTKIFKYYLFNSVKKEWFESEKTQYKRKKKIEWKTFYHNDIKMYFTTKTTLIINKYGLPVSEEIYDTDLKQIESIKTYLYEYY